MGICLGNNQANFQLHRFTRREKKHKVLGGYFFDSHCIYEMESSCYNITEIMLKRWKLSNMLTTQHNSTILLIPLSTTSLQRKPSNARLVTF